jgi:hypothetical protein
MAMSFPQDFQWDGGRIHVTNPAKNVILFKITGVLIDGAEDKIVTATDDAIARYGSVHIFHDWEDIGSYKTSTRKKLTAYVASIKPRLLSCHILFSSAVVAMGISMANRILGEPLKAYSDRSRFEAALSEILK